MPPAALQLRFAQSSRRAMELVTDGVAASSVSWQQTFIYDRYGNRNFHEDGTNTLEKGCSGQVCPALKKLLNPSISAANNRINVQQDSDGIADYLFDDTGNNVKTPDGYVYIYDGENKQIEVWNGSLPIGQYFYDGDGKRVKKVAYDHNGVAKETTIFVYDATGRLVEEFSTLLNPTPQVSYLTNDHLGSPRINTNENGAVVSRHDYHPFGEEIVSQSRPTGTNYSLLGYVADDNRKQFTGYERDDETGLDFAQARYFSSRQGRFSSPDDFLNDADVGDPMSWNLYAYVRNNPLSYTDPSGKALWINVNGTKYQYVQCDGQYKFVDEAGEDYTGDDQAVAAAASFLNNMVSGQWQGEVKDMMRSGYHEFSVTLDPNQPVSGGVALSEGVDSDTTLKDGPTIYAQRIVNTGGGLSITGNNAESGSAFTKMLVQAHSRINQTVGDQQVFGDGGAAQYDLAGQSVRQRDDAKLAAQVDGEPPEPVQDPVTGRMIGPTRGSSNEQANINCPYSPLNVPPPPPPPVRTPKGFGGGIDWVRDCVKYGRPQRPW